MRVSIAFDGWQGYSRACASLPDLILLDLHMPGLDGLGVCRLLKADATTAAIPVIVLSASTAREARLEALRCGAVDFVCKPFDPEEVLMRIGIHLSLAGRGPGLGLLGVPLGVHPGSSPGIPVAAPDPVPEPTTNDDQGRHRTPKASRRPDGVFVRAAMSLLDQHLAQPPSLAQIAAKVGTHERRLSRAFVSHTGQTVFGFLREARLARASRLLAQSPLSVQEVAAEVGFKNPANFATAFRRRFGMTPGAARKG